MQVRDSLKMYNNLVERCFKECAEDMRSKALSSGEEKVCVGKSRVGDKTAGQSRSKSRGESMSYGVRATLVSLHRNRGTVLSSLSHCI